MAANFSQALRIKNPFWVIDGLDFDLQLRITNIPTKTVKDGDYNKTI